MRLNWTIKLHVHNHYCGNSCGKIGELSLDNTIRHWECLKWPSFFFNFTLMLICCGIHSADIYASTRRSVVDDCHVWFYRRGGSGQLSARSTIHSPAVWIHLYLFICSSLYIFISIFHKMSMWFGLPCYPWQSVLLQKSACKWWENVY